MFLESHGRCRDDNRDSPKLCVASLVMDAVAIVIRCLKSGKDFGVNRYSARWFHVKVCGKCTLLQTPSSITVEHTNCSVVG